MKKETIRWLFIYLIPYVLFGILSPNHVGFFLLPLGGTIGMLWGLERARNSELLFNIPLSALCIISILLFVIGYKFRDKIWGKVINAFGVYIWCIAGLSGLGPM